MDKNGDAAREFCMNFVACSDQYRRQFTEPWREVLASFVVKPEWGDMGTTATPYNAHRVYRAPRNQVVLKDPETHKLVMTYVSKLVRALLGDQHKEYVQARPIGYEDANKSRTVTRLLKYALSLPGSFRSLVETLVDMCLFGTSVVEVPWSYIEREMLVRTATSELGVETFTETRLTVPVYDDIKIIPIDINDFYPDPSRYRIQDMNGAAKRFRMTAFEARTMGRSGVYNEEATERAIRKADGSTESPNKDNFRVGLDQPDLTKAQTDFRDMIGYEYWGDIPIELKIEDDLTGQRITRGVITVLNDERVRARAYPLADPALPFHSFIINPVQGRFYGISPAEVVRFDQSFADAMKMLIAQAVIRQVHPPIAFDPDADVDVAALKAWKADAVIAARGGPNSIGTLRYGADINTGMAVLQALKIGIQDTSGAMGGIQGQPGPDREAASVGMQRLQFAMDRPELAGMVIENECLPSVGAAILRRYQQFLEGTDDLKKRVGEIPEPVWIGDIMGDFDIQFVGSRMIASRQMKLQAFDRLVSYAQAVPSFQAVLPNNDIAAFVIGDLLELPEVAGQIGNPRDVIRNIMAMRMLGPGGAGNNGVPTSGEPSPMLPMQAAGGVSE